MKDELAPAGAFPDDRKEVQVLANQRARINAARYREGRMTRSHRTLGPFLHRLASHPERIRGGRIWELEVIEDVTDLFDHIRLYNRDGRPYAAIFHPYTRLDLVRMKALVNWASEVGLQLCVDADSEYYPGVTLRLVLYREGEEFPPTDSA